jgi:hypothetical protein
MHMRSHIRLAQLKELVREVAPLVRRGATCTACMPPHPPPTQPGSRAGRRSCRPFELQPFARGGGLGTGTG